MTKVFAEDRVRTTRGTTSSTSIALTYAIYARRIGSFIP